MTPLPTVSQAAARRLPLHQRIVWARKRQGISQEDLAGRIGTSRRHMIRIEKGLHRPGPVFRLRIAEATDQPGDFFEDEDDEEAAPAMSLDEHLKWRVDAQVRAAMRDLREESA